MHRPAELSRRVAFFAELLQEVALLVENLDAVVARVADKDLVADYNDPDGLIELTGT